MISTTCEKTWSSGVIPRVRPTVPTAEAASYRQSKSGRPSYTLIAIPPPKNKAKYNMAIVAAFFITWYSSLRPKAPAFSWLRNVAIAFKISTEKVVVFIPPAVDPGEPPISINNIITAFDASLISEMFIVLNPAVLVVTDWNVAANRRFPMGNFVRSQI